MGKRGFVLQKPDCRGGARSGLCIAALIRYRSCPPAKGTAQMNVQETDMYTAEVSRLRRRVADLEKQLADYELANEDQTRARLLQTLSLVEAAFEATADGILVVDQNNHISRFNQRFVELWHIPP